ncbi:hypothetical protein MBLNU459_g3081t1 [Dothideomycetes sp. NU459]
MGFQTSGPVSFTKATLSYPVYAVDFDPYNRGYVVVAGGGGEGRSGVGNKITLLDASSRATLDPVAEIELSRDEDSVTTIANLASKDGLVTLAGINSSEADQKAGTNMHLRTFQVQYPRRKRPTDKEEKADGAAEGSISFAAKAALFKADTRPKPETYQRLLRLSPAHKRETGNKRIGAIATGLAKDSEIVLFDATRTPPKESELIARIPIRDNAEAADLDIIDTYDNTFSVTWCTDYDVYEQTVVHNFSTGKSEFAPANPRKVHSIPLREGADKPARSKYRSVRFLTDETLLLLSNLPNRKGAELSILHLYPSGPCMVLFHKILPSHIKQAVALDVCALDADSQGNRQVVVAVAGQDISIWVAVLNYNNTTKTFSPFRTFTTLRDVHPLQMTSLRFSPFHSPARAPPPALTPGGKLADPVPGAPPPPHPQPQYIKLVSASMGNTVVVDTMALSPLEPSKQNSRYVLSHPSDEARVRNIYIFFISFIVLMSAVLLQGVFFPESTSLSSYIPLPENIKSFLARPATVADGIGRGGREYILHAAASSASSAVPSSIPAAGAKLRDLLHLHSSSAEHSSKAIILRADPSDPSSRTELSVDVVPDRQEYLKQDVQARHWHELAEHEREAWKQRLLAAGEWTLDEGETVLKGILFSSWAGFVGSVAGEAIREL